MDRMNTQKYRELAQYTSFPCVSLYLPMERAGRDVRGNSVRCRNLLDQAAQQLSDRQMGREAVEDLLQPAVERLSDNDYWRHQSDGLAIFLTAGEAKFFQLPLPFQEEVAVGERFHLTPLLPLLNDDSRFLVLAVSAKEVRLFEGSQHGLQQIVLSTLPEDLVNESNTTANFGVTGGDPGPLIPGQAGESVFRGEASMGDSQRMNGEIQNYFERINRGLQPLLANERAPLVFAGIEKYFATFRNTVHYQHIVPTPITAGASNLSVDELHQQAWQIVQPMFQVKRHEKIDRFASQVGTGLASSQPELVVMAARQGAVDTLFVQRRGQCWGRIDEGAQQAVLHPHHQQGDEDLLDQAAAQTLLNSGAVYVVEPNELPQSAPLAAIFRYPVSPAVQPNAGWGATS